MLIVSSVDHMWLIEKELLPGGKIAKVGRGQERLEGLAQEVIDQLPQDFEKLHLYSARYSSHEDECDLTMRYIREVIAKKYDLAWRHDEDNLPLTGYNVAPEFPPLGLELPEQPVDLYDWLEQFSQTHKGEISNPVVVVVDPSTYAHWLRDALHEFDYLAPGIMLVKDLERVTCSAA